MRTTARDLALPGLAALAGSLLLAWAGLLTMAGTDYEREAEPAFRALQGGHLGGFLEHCPAYGGSLILRAPFALLPGVWHGGALALYRSVAVPGLLAVAALGLALFVLAGRLGAPRAAGWVALGLCVANPLTQRALETGHPEELLVGALCLGAALLADAGRPLPAGALLGLAAAGKPWAVVAVVPVVLMLEHGRLRALGAAAGAGALLLAPILLHGGSSVGLTATVARQTGEIFHPWQTFWFLGERSHVTMRALGGGALAPGDARTPPALVSHLSHPLAVLVPLAVSLAWWSVRGARPREEALLLLALAFLMRCLLDTWNTSYYSLPFLLALCAWELHRRRVPVLTLACAALAWTTLVLSSSWLGPDAQAVAYLAWTVPLAAGLGLRLLAPARFAGMAARPAAALRSRLPSLARAVAAPGL